MALKNVSPMPMASFTRSQSSSPPLGDDCGDAVGSWTTDKSSRHVMFVVVFVWMQLTRNMMGCGFSRTGDELNSKLGFEISMTPMMVSMIAMK